MSQYSEMMGSFIRTGGYPLEADYIFESEEQLKEFYQDEYNKPLLHKGWFKIVDNGEIQSLYWIVNQEGELIFTKVISEGDINKINKFLNDLNTKLEDEISKREENDTDEKDRLAYIEESIKAIVGSENSVKEYLETLDYKNLTELSTALNAFLNTYTENDSIDTLPEIKDFLSGYTHTHNLEQVLEDLWNKIEGDPTPNLEFRTLRGIQDFITLLAQTTKNRDDNLQAEINQTQIGVGLDSDGSFSPDQETNYLKTATSVMNALRTLDSLINQAINNCNIQPKETNTVTVDILKEPAKTTISANVKLSPDPSNDLQAKEDGLYHNIDSEYKDGILTIKVNGNIRQQHVLGLSSVVDDAYYDADKESIVIIFKLQNNDKQTITIPVATLISEWDVDNSIATKVIELTKQRVVSGGADKLSADVRISTNKDNILEKDGNTLLVRGTADNIRLEDKTLKEVIQAQETEISDINDSITNTNTTVSNINTRLTLTEQSLATEVQDRKDEIANLDSKLNDEITNRSTATQNLTTALNKETADRIKGDSDNANLITEANAKITNLQTDLTTLNSSLSTEIQDRKDAVQTLRDDLERKTDKLSSDIADVVKDVNTNTAAITTLDQKVDNTLQEAKTYTDSKVSEEKDRALAAEKAIQDRVAALTSSITVKQQTTPEVGFAATYQVMVDGLPVGDKINVPEDRVVKSVLVKEVTSINDPYQGAEVGDRYIEFLFYGTSSALYLPIKDLVIKYKSGNGITIDTNDTISAKVFVNDKYLEVGSDGIKSKGIDDAISTAKQEVTELIKDKAPIDSPILTGIPQVETSPDAEDSSQRIPSTNWVRARILENPTSPETYWLILTEE